MARCEEHEVAVSALLDGELERVEALACVDHLLSCESCREFYRSVRGADDLLDAAEAYRHSGASAAALWARLEEGKVIAPERRTLYGVPTWALKLAAALAVTTGLWLFGLNRLAPALASDRPVTVSVASRPDSMTDRRFVKLTRELLQSDRRYQRKMLEILTAVGSEGAGGSRERTGARTSEEPATVSSVPATGEPPAPAPQLF